jgi:hypothetical protein
MFLCGLSVVKFLAYCTTSVTALEREADPDEAVTVTV